MALSGSTPAPSWEEDECLDYYGMLSLHRMFEVVGGQLTDCELELLAFLLDEAPGAAGGLARTRSGLELLLELERRGQCEENNLRLLGQLLRVLARHDLLPHLARKRRRPVSPERYNYGTSSSSSKRTEGSCQRRRQSSISSDSQPGQWDTDSLPTKRQRRSRGRPSGGARRRQRGVPLAPQQQQEPTRPPSEGKVTCGEAADTCAGCHQEQRNRVSPMSSDSSQLPGMTAHGDSPLSQVVITRAIRLAGWVRESLPQGGQEQAMADFSYLP
ncbi:DNA-binding death effector domain-containing protein 2 isoform X2 [Heterocephalus glaber]|uniref:DNA-binding death effector domain-containing protein 2 n=1 Tax=Heterocephalus glaber TaxID=10181 RepID=A0AAX6SF42_HETGA|nr:DNA-binding death effector domain-containing protein 2 isoform X2 [Heterocephalus glaber]